jgi:hypothetical protein
MSEFSMFWTTGATGDGANPYTMGQTTDWLRRFFTSDSGATQGVLPGYNNELAVVAGAGKVTVDTGGGSVYGFPYENTAVVDVSIPTPAAKPRIDRVVLRCSWAAQTVRITRIAGTEADTPVAPAITQTASTTWDILLAQVHITTGAVITVTDERSYIHPAARVATENIDDGAVTAIKIAAGIVGTTQLADNGVTADKLAHAIDASALGFNAQYLQGYGPGDFLGAVVNPFIGAVLYASCTLGGTDGHRPVPSGGSADENWHLCNGQTVNGIVLPNLLDKFIIGAGSTYTLGQAVGAATINLYHSHGLGTLAVTSHTLPNHIHSKGGLTTQQPALGETIPDRYGTVGDVVVIALSEHHHVLTGDMGNPTTNPSMTHTLTGALANALSATQSIIPPSIALYPFMRVA